MNEKIKKLALKLASDENLQAKMQAFSNLDEAYAFAVSVQDGFTKEEFAEAMAKLPESASMDDELTDDDLASVAGGVDTATIADTFTGGVLVDSQQLDLRKRGSCEAMA